MNSDEWSIVTPETVQKIFNSLKSDATLASEAAEFISDLFNKHTETVLRLAHRTAANRATTNLTLDTSNINQATIKVHNTDNNSLPNVEYCSPLDTGNAALEIADLSKYLHMPKDCSISLTAAEHTNLFGPIRTFTPIITKTNEIFKGEANGTNTTLQPSISESCLPTNDAIISLSVEEDCELIQKLREDICPQ